MGWLILPTSEANAKLSNGELEPKSCKFPLRVNSSLFDLNGIRLANFSNPPAVLFVRKSALGLEIPPIEASKHPTFAVTSQTWNIGRIDPITEATQIHWTRVGTHFLFSQKPEETPGIPMRGSIALLNSGVSWT